MEYRYTPDYRVCSQEMIIELDGDIIKKVTIVGGCAGNTVGVSRLVEGMKIDEAIKRLKGIPCGGRGTSCPDQLAIALEEAKEKIEKQKREANIFEPKNLEEQAISLIGKDIYYTLIKEYTEKQWGRDCTSLPSFIIKRLPVRFTFDNNYFNDSYQGIPIGGYNKLIDGLLDGIEVKISTDFFENREKWESEADKIVYTGKIDEYFDFRFGKLEYRTVRFETEVLNIENYQGNAVVNYTSHEQPYTRIIEHKHFEPENPVYNNKKTIISKEFSTEWKEGMESFYPVNDEKNAALFSKYNELAKKEKNVIFGGRLAEYKYYDMDDIIEKVMKDVNRCSHEK